MKIVYILTLFSLIVGCANNYTSNEKVTSSKPDLTQSKEERWSLMVGKWYGSQPTKEGGVKQHTIERAIDGSYKIVFRVTDANGKVEESSEVGHWGVSGPIYFSIFRGWLSDGRLSTSDPTSPYNYDAYKIINLSTEDFEYESFSSGNRYKIKRVPNDFEFPK